MQLEVLTQAFTVCKPVTLKDVDLDKPFCFVARTDQELSLVCPTAFAPAHTEAREDGWRAFRVAGSMAFSLVGILARLTGTLAQRGIPVFTVSTFDTDYVLVKAEHFSDAMDALAAAGYEIR